MNRPSVKVQFPNANGELISGKLELPHFEPKAFAIFAHCFTCSKNVGAATRISQALTQNDIAVLRFDFTGLGNSEGDFSNTNFSSNIDDLKRAYEYLSENYETPKLLIGHSLGGAAVLAAGLVMPNIQAVITVGAPSDVPHVSHLFKDHLDEIENRGEAKVDLAGREFLIKKQFVDDLKTINLDDKISRLKKALLIFHSPQDEIVSIDHAKDIYVAAKHPKSFVSLDGADHLLTNKDDADYVADVIASWSKRYIKGKTVDRHLETEEVIVQSSGKKFTNVVYTKNHQSIADEPKELGGSDLGPNPYEYLLAGLGACTSMTIRMYANHKKMSLEDVRVTLKHEKIHAKDCEDCETQTGKIDKITRVVSVSGDLTDDEKLKIMEIADKCPVHKTLHQEIKIVSTMD